MLLLLPEQTRLWDSMLTALQRPWSLGALMDDMLRRRQVGRLLDSLAERAAGELGRWHTAVDLEAAADCLQSDALFSAEYRLLLHEAPRLVFDPDTPAFTEPRLERLLLGVWGSDHTTGVRRVARLMALHLRWARESHAASPIDIDAALELRERLLYDLTLSPDVSQALVRTGLVDVYFLAAWGMRCAPTEAPSAWMGFLLAGMEVGLGDALRLLAQDDTHRVETLVALGLSPLDTRGVAAHALRVQRALAWIDAQEPGSEVFAPFAAPPHDA